MASRRCGRSSTRCWTATGCGSSHPIPARRRIVRVDEHGEVLSERPSPKKPGAALIFEGLVSFPTLLSHPNLVIEVLLCREDHIRKPAPVRGRRYLRDPVSGA